MKSIPFFGKKMKPIPVNSLEPQEDVFFLWKVIIWFNLLN